MIDETVCAGLSTVLFSRKKHIEFSMCGNNSMPHATQYLHPKMPQQQSSKSEMVRLLGHRQVTQHLTLLDHDIVKS